MTHSTPDTFAAFVGIDWAEAKHAVCLQAAGATKRECFQREHTPVAAVIGRAVPGPAGRISVA